MDVDRAVGQRHSDYRVADEWLDGLDSPVNAECELNFFLKAAPLKGMRQELQSNAARGVG